MNESAESTGAPAEEPGQRRTLGIVARILGLAVSVAVIAAALILLRGRGATSPSAGGPLDARVPVVNQPAPNFELRDLSGRTVRVSDLRGQILLVNFWATWCIPCREEMPAIEQVYTDQRGNDFTALEVNEQETSSDVQSYVAQVGATPPIVLDSAGSVLAQYRFKGLPDSVLIDGSGTVRWIFYGPLTRDALLKDLADLRSGSPPHS